MSDSPLSQLRSAVEATGVLVAGVRDDQWDAATPCEEWTVRDVVAHLVNGHRVFAALLRGQQPPPAASLGDPTTTYQESAAGVLDAFGAPGALERLVTLPIGTVPGAVALGLRQVEALVHGWDLARATGQPLTADPSLAESSLAFTQQALPGIPAEHRPFRSPRPMDPGAAALDRLVSLLGRDVARGDGTFGIGAERAGFVAMMESVRRPS